MKLHKLCLSNNHLANKSAEIINQIVMKSQMRLIDLSNNNIVMSYMDNIIISSGYKSCLEILTIEGNT